MKQQPTDWIWASDWSLADDQVPKLVYFRKQFSLSSIKKGEFAISADSRYKLYLNGHLIEVGPSKGDDKVWFLDTIDVTDHLLEGRNTIGVIVLRYPTDPDKGNYSSFRTQAPGLCFSGWVEEKEQKIVIRADESWLSLIDDSFEIVPESADFAPLKIYEKVTGSPKLYQWLRTDYEPVGWSRAKKVSFSRAVSPGNLLDRTIPFMYRKKRHFDAVMTVRESIFTKPTWENFLLHQQKIEIPAHCHEIVEISAGTEMTGYLNLNLAQGQGAKISLLQSEAYVQNDSLVKKDRTDFKNGHLEGFTDSYQVGGFGSVAVPENYSPFWFRTFRFIRLEIETADQPITLVNFDYTETGYPLEVKTKITCSDPSLMAIWNLSERTLRRCMHETYEDCPFYEQLQYVMDSRAQILYSYAAAADDRLARKCIDDFARSQRYDGLLNAAYPSYNPNIIPGFSIYYILMVYDHMMYFGDRKLVEQYLPTIQAILNFFERHLAPEGYVDKIGGINGQDRYWSFIDWTPEWQATWGVPEATLKGAITMESLLYIYGLQTAAKLADFLELLDLAANYRKRAQKVQTAILTHCLGENGLIQDGPKVASYSQHVQVFAALTNTVKAEQARHNLLSTLRDKNNYAQCSVAMAFYLFRALEKTDLYEWADSYWDVWRKMLVRHCTTSVEAEVGERSECHAWGALALYELPTVILGVRPVEPGFAKIKIVPQSHHLEWAKGTVITPRGSLEISWEKTAKGLAISYQGLADCIITCK